MTHYSSILVLSPEVIIEKLKLQRATVTGSRIRCICPRKHLNKNGQLDYERNPSFGIDTEKGWYNCFTCGLRGNNLATLGEELGIQIDYIPRIVANYYKTPVIPFELDFIRYNEDKALKYFASRGITKIEKYMPGSSDDGMEIYLPIFDFSGAAIGYTKKDLRINQWQLREGMSRLHLLYGAHEKCEDDIGYIVESGPDKLQLSSWGVFAVATLSAGINDSQLEMANRVLPNSICIVAQNDAPGQRWKKKVTDFFRGVKTMYSIQIPPGINDINQMGEEFQTLDMRMIF
jgi:hypothetical protein